MRSMLSEAGASASVRKRDVDETVGNSVMVIGKQTLQMLKSDG